MSLTLLPARMALGPNVPYSFGASGGTEPYTYSVLPGGAGGSVDAFGNYTAPAASPADPALKFDTIQVQDSLGATATAEVLVGTPLDLFCDVVQQSMGLSDGRVYIWKQKIMAPTDSGLFIAVSVLNPKVFGTSREYVAGVGTVQTVNMQAELSLDIISRSTEALLRKEEVAMALNSAYSEQQQELNSFRIFPEPPNFVDLSAIEGSAIPYRYNMSVNIQYFVQKVTATDPYFDTFQDVGVVTEP